MLVKILFRQFIKRIAPNLVRRVVIWRLKSNFLPDEFLQDLEILSDRSLVIDLGANSGYITECLLQTGAQVIAFEPNKQALKNLTKLSSKFNTLTIEPVAAGTTNKKTKLYLHKDSKSSNKDFTQSSSLLATKRNISIDNFELVKQVDFVEYIKCLDRYIDLIKIDIEGMEIELINDILDRNVIDKVGRIYVETHENSIPELYQATLKLKERVELEGVTEKFYFDWP